MTEAHLCEQPAQGRLLAVERPGVELATSRVASQHLDRYTTQATRGRTIDEDVEARTLLERDASRTACRSEPGLRDPRGHDMAAVLSAAAHLVDVVVRNVSHSSSRSTLRSLIVLYVPHRPQRHLLPFINTVDKTQLHTQNGNSRSHKIQQSVFTHNSLSLNNLVCYSYVCYRHRLDRTENETNAYCKGSKVTVPCNPGNRGSQQDTLTSIGRGVRLRGSQPSMQGVL